MLFAKRLLAVWAALVGLTLVTGLAAQELKHAATVWLVPLLALASLLKARLILTHYLDLARAPDWNRAFMGVLAALALTVYGLSIIPYLR